MKLNLIQSHIFHSKLFEDQALKETDLEIRNIGLEMSKEILNKENLCHCDFISYFWEKYKFHPKVLRIAKYAFKSLTSNPYIKLYYYENGPRDKMKLNCQKYGLDLNLIEDG